MTTVIRQGGRTELNITGSKLHEDISHLDWEILSVEVIEVVESIKV